MAHEIPENFRPAKYPQQKILHPREKFYTTKKLRKKFFWTHETPFTKNVGSMKHPREKMSPQTHDGTITLNPRWHATHII